MSNSIINTIRAEIERLKKEGDIALQDAVKTNDIESGFVCGGIISTCDKLITFLDTIEAEEKEVDLELSSKLSIEIQKWLDINPRDEEGDYDLLSLARHFYELGCRHAAAMYDEIEHERQRKAEAPEGLEEAAERWAEKHPFNGRVSSFKAGAKWDRAKMIEKSYLATISANNTIPVLPMKDVSDLGLDYGDKVRVIVIKEDK